jgi:hypothetical protein
LVLAERQFPKRTADGLHLPGVGPSTVIISRSDYGITVRIEDASQPKELFQSLLHKAQLNDENVNKTLTDLRADDALTRKVLFYGAYIIEYLYLEKPSRSNNDVDEAARVAYVLIKYWQAYATQRDNQAANVLPLLWRCYWRSLAILLDEAERVAQSHRDIDFLKGEPEYAWLAIWYDLLPREYPRSLREWQAVCLDEQRAYVFAEQLAPWLNAAHGMRVRSWQQIHECEVRKLIWSDSIHHILRSPGTHTAAGRRWLRRLGDRWLVVRYDLISATRLHWQIHRAEGKSRFFALLFVIPIGASRIWAGSGIGYISTMLQGDTWEALWWMLREPYYRGLLVGVGLPLFMVAYLAYEINRQTGVSAIPRAILLAIKGQIFALILGLIAVFLLGPFFLADIKPAPTMGEWLMGAGLYAQFALAIGIFTQLIFDDRRTTDPLDVYYDI